MTPTEPNQTGDEQAEVYEDSQPADEQGPAPVEPIVTDEPDE
jgi:hypothetical protein